MPRNASGVYSLPPSYLAVGDNTATASQHNDPLEDLRADANQVRPISAGGTGAANSAAARDELGVTALLDGTSPITPNLAPGTAVDGVVPVGNFLTDGETATLGKGFDVTAFDNGTAASGSLTLDPANQNLQYAVNGGAHTLVAPASDCTMVLLYSNSATAGVVTFSGFNLVEGSPLTNIDGDAFLISIIRINGTVYANVTALQ